MRGCTTGQLGGAAFGEQAGGEQGGRLRTGLSAQAIPPQGQDSGVAPLPSGRKGLVILPVGMK